MSAPKKASRAVRDVLLIVLSVLSVVAMAGCSAPEPPTVPAEDPSPEATTEATSEARSEPAFEAASEAVSEATSEAPSAAGDPAADPRRPTFSTNRRPPRLGKVRVRLTRVAKLSQPTALAEGPDGALYVTRQEGQVHRLANGNAAMVLDLSRRVRAGGERGLLGLAFDLDGSHLYLSYIGRDRNSHVDRYTFDERGIDGSSRRQVLMVRQPNDPEATTHKGGNLAFGPDGMLYMGLGDGGPSGEPPDTSQRLDTMLGKLLRINPSRGDGYVVPADNPFVDRDGVRPEIYATGLRNPWRFSFDLATGDLWLGDVGRYVVEEVNHLRLQRLPRANFGWDLLEGSLAFRGSAPARYVAPVHEYNHDDGRCAVIAGFVYRGQAIRHLGGAFLYGDYCDGTVRALVRRGRTVVDNQPLGPRVEALSSFGQDADGELYVLSLSEGLFRLDPP